MRKSHAHVAFQTNKSSFELRSVVKLAISSFCWNIFSHNCHAYANLVFGLRGKSRLCNEIIAHSPTFDHSVFIIAFSYCSNPSQLSSQLSSCVSRELTVTLDLFASRQQAGSRTFHAARSHIFGHSRYSWQQPELKALRRNPRNAE